MRKTNNTTGKKILPIALSYQYQQIRSEIDKAIKKVLLSDRFILGEEVDLFEKEFAFYLDNKFVIGVACGTDALTLAIKTLGIKEGEGVIIAANVYPSTFGLALAGAKIQFADVDKESLNINLENIQKVVDKTTKAIVLVHLYGNPVDIDPIRDFAKKKGIYLIEDCAQSVGAKYKGRQVGTFGTINCFSFYPTKNLAAYGDGGALSTGNLKYASMLKLWRMYGEDSRYHSLFVGHNSRLDELQAAVLRVKLMHLDKWNKRRRYLAEIYKRGLQNLPIKIVKENPSGESVYHLFVILVENRDALVKYLYDCGIVSGIHYPVAAHLTQAFKYLGYKKGDFPVSETASLKVLSLPMYPELSKHEVSYVIRCIRKFYTAN